MSKIDWEQTARATMHPLTLAVLETYATLGTGEKLSPKDVAAQVGHPLPKVSHHVQILLRAELLARAGNRQVRDAIQNFYVLA